MDKTSHISVNTSVNKTPAKTSLLAEIIDQLKVILCIYILIMTGQKIAIGTAIIEMLTSAAISFAIVFFAVILKNMIKHPDLPGFAWATLLAFVLTLPISPLQQVIIEHVGKLNFLVHVTPLLAFAGISVGDKLLVMQRLSWKLIIVAMLVMASTYFFSALISQIVLKYQGLI